MSHMLYNCLHRNLGLLRATKSAWDFFVGLIFDPGIFLGFAGSPRDFFGSWLLAPFDHPRHLKSQVPPPPPPWDLGLQIPTTVWNFNVVSCKVEVESWSWCCFIRAMVIQGEEDDQGNIEPLSAMDFLLHFLTFFWKVLFAFVPPR